MFSEKKLYVVTCPTDDLKKSLIDSKIFSKDKVINLYDPVINIKEFIKKKGKNNDKFIVNENQNFFVAAGRLTKQKNFIYLIKEFKKFCNIYPEEKLIIFGEGELKNELLNEIEKKKFLQKYKTWRIHR